MLKNNFNRNLLISLSVHLLIIYLLVFASDIKSSTNYNIINTEKVIKINSLDYKDINKFQALKDKKKKRSSHKENNQDSNNLETKADNNNLENKNDEDNLKN